MVEGFSFAVADPEVAVHGDRVLIADDGMVMVAKVVVGIAEAVPCVSLPLKIIKLAEQSQGLLAVADRLGMVPE